MISCVFLCFGILNTYWFAYDFPPAFTPGVLKFVCVSAAGCLQLSVIAPELKFTWLHIYLFLVFLLHYSYDYVGSGIGTGCGSGLSISNG